MDKKTKDDILVLVLFMIVLGCGISIGASVTHIEWTKWLEQVKDGGSLFP